MLYKGKGDRADPDKYRGICLLTIISRITAKVAERRIAEYAEQEKLLNNAQWGLRRGRSTRDAIITLRMMAEMCADHEERCRQKIEAMKKRGSVQEEIEEMKKTIEDNRGMVQLIDMQKAYPNFSRELAWQVLRKHGLPESLVRVVSTFHEDTVYEVKMTITKSKKYKLRRDFREGCPSSCTTYDLVHNVAVEALQEKLEGIKFMHTSCFVPHNGKHDDEEELEEKLIKILAFADDTTAVGKLKDKEMIDQCIQRVFADHAEKVHPGKSEWMAMGMKQDTSTLGDGLSKHVRLLGRWVDMDGGVEKDNAERKTAARMTWLRLKDAVLRAKISLKTKGRIIKATVIATLLYGSEARFFRKKDVAEYQNFVDRVCRALVLSSPKQTIRRMEGKVTMQDLRNMVGFPMGARSAERTCIQTDTVCICEHAKAQRIEDEPGGRLCSVKDAMGGFHVFCGICRTVREHESVEDRTEEKPKC